MVVVVVVIVFDVAGSEWVVVDYTSDNIIASIVDIRND